MMASDIMSKILHGDDWRFDFFYVLLFFNINVYYLLYEDVKN
jgi:hypothetical protein